MPAVVAILVAIVKATEQTARHVKIGEITPATADSLLNIFIASNMASIALLRRTGR